MTSFNFSSSLLPFFFLFSLFLCRCSFVSRNLITKEPRSAQNYFLRCHWAFSYSTKTNKPRTTIWPFNPSLRPLLLYVHVFWCLPLTLYTVSVRHMSVYVCWICVLRMCLFCLMKSVFILERSHLRRPKNETHPKHIPLSVCMCVCVSLSLSLTSYM